MPFFMSFLPALISTDSEKLPFVTLTVITKYKEATGSKVTVELDQNLIGSAID